MKPITHDSIPTPAGHYSACMQHGGLLYVSGQLPVDAATGEVPSGIKAQTALVLKKLDDILRAAGSHPSHVIQTRLYVSDISLWGDVNQVYADFFGDHRPARAVVPTRELHYGALVEIEAIAAVESQPDSSQGADQ